MPYEYEEQRPNAVLVFEDRTSDSPLIERVWRARSERGGRFLSVAAQHWEMVMTRFQGRTTVTLRGPKTKPTWIDCPADGEWIAIRFKLGTFMPDLPPSAFLDRKDVNLRSLSNDGGFGLAGERWTFPEFDDAEAFVKRLVKTGLVARDAAVQAALEGDGHALSPRTAQRRILRAVGMTNTLARQIERARRATTLLKRNVPIVEVAHDAGYFDQAHLTRSMRRLIGQTPANVARAKEQLSFLYNTVPLPDPIRSA
jgi:hypothetical protein